MPQRKKRGPRKGGMKHPETEESRRGRRIEGGFTEAEEQEKGEAEREMD